MGRVLHVAQSLRADIAPAKAIGLHCVWVNRTGRVFGGARPGAAAPRPDLEVESLERLVFALHA